MLNSGVNVVICNGSIKDWGGDGIDAGISNGRIERISASDNGAWGILNSGFSSSTCILSCEAYRNGSGVAAGGISTGSGAAIQDCTTALNTGIGIGTFKDCTVSGCTARGNSGVGIFTSTASAVSGCTASSNGGDGISASTGSTVSGCTASSNGGDGISASTCTVSGCTARSNAGHGIVTSTGSTVSGCIASSNTGDGISASEGSTVSGCTVEGNTGAGLSADLGSTISDCAAIGNGTHGISASACTVSGCTARGNASDGISANASMVTGCTSQANTGDGIDVASDCRVVDNTCDSNGIAAADGAGIHVTGSDNRIDSNNVTDNDRGIDVDVSGNLIIRNSASGNTTSYSIVTGNSNAQILSPAANFVSTDPWANFAF